VSFTGFGLHAAVVAVSLLDALGVPSIETDRVTKVLAWLLGDDPAETELDADELELDVAELELDADELDVDELELDDDELDDDELELDADDDELEPDPDVLELGGPAANWGQKSALRPTATPVDAGMLWVVTPVWSETRFDWQFR
jgi:hypothetical protein